MNVLVIRNDKLGDFMLAWPAFAMLKASDPSLKLTALVPSYTAELAHACPYLDDVIIDAPKNDKMAFQRVVSEIKARQFDAMISFFSNTHNAKLAWKCRIPYRLAPATKWVQFFYNHRLTQRRSQSAKPEFEYNLDLARAFLRDHKIPVRWRFSVNFCAASSRSIPRKNGFFYTVVPAAPPIIYRLRNTRN